MRSHSSPVLVPWVFGRTGVYSATCGRLDARMVRSVALCGRVSDGMYWMEILELHGREAFFEGLMCGYPRLLLPGDAFVESLA